MRLHSIGASLLIPVLLGSVVGCHNSQQPQPNQSLESAPGEAIDIGALPPAVVNGMQASMPGAKLTKAKKLTDGNYLLNDVKLDHKEYTVMVSPDGKIIKQEEDN